MDVVQILIVKAVTSCVISRKFIFCSATVLTSMVKPLS